MQLTLSLFFHFPSFRTESPTSRETPQPQKNQDDGSPYWNPHLISWAETGQQTGQLPHPQAWGPKVRCRNDTYGREVGGWAGHPLGQGGPGLTEPTPREASHLEWACGQQARLASPSPAHPWGLAYLQTQGSWSTLWVPIFNPTLLHHPLNPCRENSPPRCYRRHSGPPGGSAKWPRQKAFQGGLGGLMMIDLSEALVIISHFYEPISNMANSSTQPTWL